MALWREHLHAYLNRNAGDPTSHSAYHPSAAWT